MKPDFYCASCGNSKRALVQMLDGQHREILARSLMANEYQNVLVIRVYCGSCGLLYVTESIGNYNDKFYRDLLRPE